MKRFGHAAHAQPFSFLTGVAVALVTVNAIAQEPAAPAPAPAAPAPAAPAPAAPAPAAPAAEAPAPAAPAPAPAAEMPPMEAAPAPTAEPAPAAAAPAEAAPVDAAPVAAEAAAEAPAEEEEASTGLTWNLFVDGSYSYTTARSGTPVPTHRAWETNSFNSTTGRTTNNGFNLHWLGLDAAYDAGEFAATGSLRFGTAVPIYFGANRSDLGTENLTQAYVSWRPADKLNLDLGQFNTIYGAEVAESWKNLNYSRGALYYAMQPSHHTGLRINYAISDAVTLNGLIVNGANTVVDDNDKPSVGLQIAATPSDSFSLYAGYLGAFEPSTDVDLFSHFFDLVATVKAGDLTLVLNGDYNIHADAIPAAGGGFDNAAFFGVSAAAGYQLSDMWGLALRFEHLGDSDNSLYGATTSTGAPASDVSVNTLTGTIDVKPVKGVANLIVRWDNRLEFASEEIFFNKDSVGTDKWFASILGVVVQTNN